MVKKITDMLNEKTFTPIPKEIFKINYSDSNDKVRFWLSTSVESEAAKKDFYPYSIFIDNDLYLYVMPAKAADSRFLKSTISENEYKFIEDLYNDLYKKKQEL